MVYLGDDRLATKSRDNTIEIVDVTCVRDDLSWKQKILYSSLHGRKKSFDATINVPGEKYKGFPITKHKKLYGIFKTLPSTVKKRMKINKLVAA